MVITEIGHVTDLSRHSCQLCLIEASEETAEELVLPNEVLLEDMNPRMVLLIGPDVG